MQTPPSAGDGLISSLQSRSRARIKLPEVDLDVVKLARPRSAPRAAHILTAPSVLATVAVYHCLPALQFERHAPHLAGSSTARHIPTDDTALISMHLDVRKRARSLRCWLHVPDPAGSRLTCSAGVHGHMSTAAWRARAHELRRLAEKAALPDAHSQRQQCDGRLCREACSRPRRRIRERIASQGTGGSRPVPRAGGRES